MMLLAALLTGAAFAQDHQGSSLNNQHAEGECFYSAWAPWSAPCNCAGGISERTRSRLRMGGSPAYCADTSQSMSCDCVQCEPEELWSSLGCSVTCGAGMEEQVRKTGQITIQNTCESEYRTVACEMAGCPVDCVMSGWYMANECAAAETTDDAEERPSDDKKKAAMACQFGIEEWVRDILVNPANGGEACPDDDYREEECIFCPEP